MATSWANIGAGSNPTTTNATETFAVNWQCEPDSQGYFTGVVFAGKADGTCKYWNIFGRFKRIGSGTPSIVGGISNLFGPNGDLAAVTWSVSFEAETDGTIEGHIVGQAATTIQWTFNVVGVQVYDA